MTYESFNEDIYSDPHETTLTEERLVPPSMRRRFVMAQSMLEYAAWVERLVETNDSSHGLLPHQIYAFLAVAEWVRGHANAITAQEDLTLKGYLDLPTSFGKTVMMAKIATAFGVGEPTEKDSPKRRALVLVPHSATVRQTIGGADGGFGQHAPGLKCTPYYSGGHDLSGDVVVMTYSSFDLFVKDVQAGVIEDPQFDIVFCDEAHHALGAQKRAALEAYSQGKIAIGLTATPEYNDTKKISHLFPAEIYKADFLTLIEAGALSGVQLIGLATGSTVESSTNSREFSEDSLRHLRYDDDRNTSIVQITQQLISEGRRGVINAIAGDYCQHAQDLAGMLDGQDITLLDGTTHKIRAAAIGGFLTANRKRQILQDYKNKLYDVIVQVDLLNESWDESDVSFIVNAALTASKVKATQRIGRGMRNNSRWPLTVIVEFADNVIGKLRPVTAWDVFDDGESDFSQNRIITSRKNRERMADQHNAARKRGARRTVLSKTVIHDNHNNENENENENDDPDSAIPLPPGDPEHPVVFNINNLPGPLKAMSDNFEMHIVRELTMRARNDMTRTAPPNGVRLADLAPIGRLKNLRIYALRNVLTREGGFTITLVNTARGPESYISKEAEEFLRNYEGGEYAPKGYKIIAKIMTELKTTREIIEPIITRLERQAKITPQEYRDRATNRKLKHYSPEDQLKVKAEFEADAPLPPEDGSIILLPDLAAEVNERRETVRFFLARHHSILGDLYRSPQSGHTTRGFNKDEAGIVRFHYNHELIPKGGATLEELVHRSGLSEEVFLERAAKHGVKSTLRQGRFADAGGNYHYTLFSRPEHINNLLDAVASDRPVALEPERTVIVARAAPEPTTEVTDADLAGAIPVQDVLDEVRCEPGIALFLLRQVPNARGGAFTHPTTGVRMLKAYVARLLRRRCDALGTPPSTSWSDIALAERWDVTVKEIRGLVAGLTPAASEVGLYRTSDERSVITYHYAARLALRIEHVMAQKYGKRKEPFAR